MKVKIKSYKIEKCGYYKGKTTTALAGNENELFDQILKWTKNLSLIQRSTNEDDEKISKSYFLNLIKNKNGDFFITIWISSPITNRNSVVALSGEDNPSLKFPDVKTRKFPKKYIPGYAVYFWISPSKKIVSSILIEREKTGIEEFQNLILGFLKMNPNYTIKEKRNSDGIIIKKGYLFDSNKPELLALPKFELTPIRKQGNLDYIKNNITKVTSIQGRTMTNKDDGKTYSKFFSFLLGNEEERRNERNVSIKFEIPCNLTEEDFNNIYSNWKDNESVLTDAGFKIDNSVYWLSHDSEIKVDMNISKINEEIYSLEDIKNEIEKKLDFILGDINEKE